MSADHRQPVADICRRLDGVPLALELAAARMRSMGPSDIASRLDERFRLLTAGRRTAVPRHQTLRGTIDWSYDLLTEPEQRLFNRLSVFVGGFSMEAAEQVCSEGAIDQLDVVDLVASLVDKSMVLANDTSLGSRYRILETLRQYGDEHAAEAGEADWLARRHGEYFVDLAEQAEEGVRGPDEAHWVQVFNAELGNLRAAHLWTIEAKETDLAMRLAATTPLYGILRLRFELLSWALPAIELPGATDHSLYPYVCGTACFGLWAQGRFKEAKAYGELAIKGEAELGVTPTWLPRHALMAVALNEGEMERANALTDEQLELTKAAGDKVRFAHVLLCKAVWLYEFEEESQLRIAETAAKIAKEGENPSMIAATGWGLAFALEETDPPRAMRVIRESIDLCRSIEYRWVLANALTLECSLQVQFGDARDALPPMDEAIDLWHRAGDRASQWKTVRSGIAALSQLGNFESAATIHGASADKSLMGELPTGLAKKLADELGRIEGEMGGDAFKAAVARGEAMSDDEIIAFTRSEIARILAGKVRT